MLGFTIIAEHELDLRVLADLAQRLFPEWQFDSGADSFALHSGAGDRFIRVFSFGKEGERVHYDKGETDMLPMRTPRFAPVFYRQSADGRVFLKEILSTWPRVWIDNDYVLASASDFIDALDVEPAWDLSGTLPTSSTRS